MSRRECDDQACDHESFLRSNGHQEDIENDIPLYRTVLHRGMMTPDALDSGLTA